MITVPRSAGARSSDPLAADLVEAVKASPLAAGLFDLTNMTVLAANEAALALIGLEKEPVGSSILGFTADPSAVGTQLGMLADGVINGYEAEVEMCHQSGETVRLHTRVRRVESTTLAVAFAWVDSIDTGAMDMLGAVIPVAFGELDDRWRIATISADAVRVLHVPPSALVGQSLLGMVHPDDAGAMVAALTTARAGSAVEVAARIGLTQFETLRITFLSLPGEGDGGVGFVLAPTGAVDVETSPRSELELRLWRIAFEVEAAGMGTAVPTRAMAGLPPLSTRQAEIVERLLRGERVPTIAAGLHVSESTVRNHLQAVFRKFGVHSQAELVRELRAIR